MFSELKGQILIKYEKDGEAYFQNVEKFFKEFEKRINNAKPRKKKFLIIFFFSHLYPTILFHQEKFNIIIFFIFISSHSSLYPFMKTHFYIF